ncbi:hypothetical protein [Streptomyces sp. NPDC090022]|uniref:DUF7144 family membrane protein n=1 Tax=Streptomyces sp. NPDC090022 TaxID=3365920 RepID=UPI003825B07B
MTATPGGAPRTTPSAAKDPYGGWVSGPASFAGFMLSLFGVSAIFEGIAALANDDVYLGVGDYTFAFNLTTWGWIHLILGVLSLVTGLALLKGQAWARYAGLVLATLSVIANFIWLPYQPWWSLIAIAIGLYIVYALCFAVPRAR